VCLVGVAFDFVSIPNNPVPIVKRSKLQLSTGQLTKRSQWLLFFTLLKVWVDFSPLQEPQDLRSKTVVGYGLN